ncbi:MAG TPA: hypothetical protein VH092_23230 [Urbifossiella sp.]|jgi:hypothetical protein|nr:hypothetical protein [Urbifossiella sp.]
MTTITINRCPFCPSIGSQVEGIAQNVERDLGLPVHVEDGAQEELSVLMDGVEVIRRTGDALPTTEQVEAAIQDAHPVTV